MKLMTFDIGGTEIKYSVMDERFRMENSGSVPTPQTGLDALAEMIAGIYMPHRERVEGIAVSLPGFIDTKNGVVRGGGALAYNWGQPVGPRLSAACGGCRVVLENDGKAAAVAELAAGSLRGCRNASVFIIGTGVGGGLIVDGRVVRGIHGTAGEFSFINAAPQGWPDLHSYVAFQCSTTGLLEIYREKRGLRKEIPLDGRRFFADVHNGDPAAMETLESFARAVAVQAYNLAVLLDIEKLAIGGGISRQPILTGKIREAYDMLMREYPIRQMAQALPRPEIVTCHFGSEANQAGAFCSYLNALKNGALC